MAKDPAFLFYPGDWVGGTMLFTRAHKGAYMDLLMAQYNNGHLPIEDIEAILGPDFESMWDKRLKAKFKVDENGHFFNEKLDKTLADRRRFTESRIENLRGKKKKTPHMDTHTHSHMDNHMENVNVNENKEEKKGIEKSKKREKLNLRDLIPADWPGDEFTELFGEFRKMRDAKKKPMTDLAVKRAIKALLEFSGSNYQLAKKIVYKSIDRAWEAFYPLKEDDYSGFNQNTKKDAGKPGFVRDRA